MTRVTEWFLGIVGAIAAFLGAFILVGGENEYLGLGGDLTWRVGDIPAGWAYGLLSVGGVLLLLTLVLVLGDIRGKRVHRRQSEFAGLMWHTGIFVAVNAFLWIQDIAAGGGLEYAFWTTIPWGAGLLIHALVFMFAGRRAVMPIPAAISQEEETRELQPH